MSETNYFEVSCVKKAGLNVWCFKLKKQGQIVDSLNVSRELMDNYPILEDHMNFEYKDSGKFFWIYLAAEYYISVYPDSIIVSEIEGIP
ncbi:hypothetical protein [Reichenbachiella versicolor]|uniref:hypothetical protein n=1 Tax=Reichenbachiella versicolor TaxID=1821036 RepID=UPI0013A54F9E|nr:hypothetical protein [Reichenbachiella versicolor]